MGRWNIYLCCSPHDHLFVVDLLAGPNHRGPSCGRGHLRVSTSSMVECDGVLPDSAIRLESRSGTDGNSAGLLGYGALTTPLILGVTARISRKTSLTPVGVRSSTLFLNSYGRFCASDPLDLLSVASSDGTPGKPAAGGAPSLLGPFWDERGRSAPSGANRPRLPCVRVDI